MSEAVQIALIASVPPTLVALASVFISLWNGRKIKAVHNTVNGKLSEILKNSKAAGKQEEREDEAGRKENDEQNKK